MPPDCIFCSIVEGKLPCYKVYEDGSFLAFLDIFPNTRGMTLVIPKKHHSSDIFELPEKTYLELMKASKKVAKAMEKGLNVKRVAFVCEGLGVDHMHVKLYPLHGLNEKFKEFYAPEKKFFEKYEGYVTTLLGPRADDKELEKTAQKIKKQI